MQLVREKASLVVLLKVARLSSQCRVPLCVAGCAGAGRHGVLEQPLALCCPLGLCTPIPWRGIPAEQQTCRTLHLLVLQGNVCRK